MWQQTKLFTLSHIKAVSVPASGDTWS